MVVKRSHVYTSGSFFNQRCFNTTTFSDWIFIVTGLLTGGLISGVATSIV
jgi:hypothetical protein